jgi:hypothetical protein
MNGSNHLIEFDASLMGFCSECEMKVWWACGTDPVARYRRLSEFAKAAGLNREARFWRAGLEAVSR